MDATQEWMPRRRASAWASEGQGIALSPSLSPEVRSKNAPRNEGECPSPKHKGSSLPRDNLEAHPQNHREQGSPACPRADGRGGAHRPPASGPWAQAALSPLQPLPVSEGLSRQDFTHVSTELYSWVTRRLTGSQSFLRGKFLTQNNISKEI